MSSNQWKPSSIFQVFSPYFQNGWSGLSEDMATDVILTEERGNSGLKVELDDDGYMTVCNPYTKFMIKASDKKAILAFGMKETKRHLGMFRISPWIEFLHDAAWVITPNGDNGFVDIDMNAFSSSLQTPLIPANMGLLSAFQDNLTGIVALDLKRRPDGTTYIPGFSPVARMASCVYDAADPNVAFMTRPGGRPMTWIFDSNGTYTLYGKNILKMIKAADTEVVEALATAYTVARNRQKPRK